MTGHIESRVPFNAYTAIEAINITRLKHIRRSPQHYQEAIAGQAKDSAPMQLGRAAHCAVLEPERFVRDFAVWERRTEGGDMAPRRGQHWEAFKASVPDKEIITADEYADVLAIQRAVRGDAVAMKYLSAGDPEVTLEWQLGGRRCKGRVDWLTTVDGEPVLVGLKTARDCRLFPFSTAAAKLAYHLQWAFYFDGYQLITGRAPKVKEIVVESDAPHAVVVYDIPEDVILQGRDEYEALLAKLAECEKAGKWPGPSEGFEQMLTLPSWVYEKHDDIADLELE